MPEVMVFPGNTSSYFDKQLTLIFSGKVFVVVSYKVLSELLCAELINEIRALVMPTKRKTLHYQARLRFS